MDANLPLALIGRTVCPYDRLNGMPTQEAHTTALAHSHLILSKIFPAYVSLVLAILDFCAAVPADSNLSHLNESVHIDAKTDHPPASVPPTHSAHSHAIHCILLTTVLAAELGGLRDETDHGSSQQGERGHRRNRSTF